MSDVVPLALSRLRSPSLRFHNVHGDNIDILHNGKSAKCLQNYGKGFVFSAQPIKINQKISIKISELSDQFAGVCFGFTSKNPNNLLDTEIPYNYLEFNMKPGYWLWPLFKHFCQRDSILFYFVTRSGEVHFGIDGQEKDTFFKKIDVRGPLWALMEISGQSTEIEIVNNNNSVINIQDIQEQEERQIEVEEEEEEDKENAYYEYEDFVRKCIICCENSINAVLYTCGHMCMCYKCARGQWKGPGLGNCPVCRTVIRDVIRTYK